MLSSKIRNAGLQLPMGQLMSKQIYSFRKTISQTNLKSHYFTDSFRSLFVRQAHNLSSKSLQIDNNVSQGSIQTNESVIEKVNNQISQQNEGRLFAVVHLCGKQFKITSGDIILVEGYWPPNIGDKLRLDKVIFIGYFFQSRKSNSIYRSGTGSWWK